MTDVTPTQKNTVRTEEKACFSAEKIVLFYFIR